MDGAAQSRRLRVALYLLVAVVVAWLAARPIHALLEALLVRFDYPFDLEWMEGAQLVHAERFLQGEPIYVACDDGFVPLPYPPLHFATLAAGGAFFGVDYAMGRAVSIVALALLIGLLAREVWRAAPTKASAELLTLLCVGAIAAGYPAVDGWYDLIRVDTLCVALVVAATSVVASGGDNPSDKRAVAVAVLLTLAFFAKQTAAAFAPWLALVLWRRRRRAALVMMATGALCCVVVVVLLQLATDGRYWTETVIVMSRHHLIGHLARRAVEQLWVFMPYLLLVPPLWLFAWRMGWLQRRTSVWVGLWLFALPQSIVASSKAAAHVNNLMMAVVLSGPVLLMLCGDVARGLRKLARPVLGDAVAAAALLLCCWFAWPWQLHYPQYLPTPRDRAQALELDSFVARLGGRVLMPEHPFVPVRNGGTLDQPITQAYHDHGSLPAGAFDAMGCASRMDADWALLGSLPTPLMRGLVARKFVLFGAGVPLLRMRSGYPTHPRWLLKRRVDHQRHDIRVLFDFEDGRFDGWSIRGRGFGAEPRQAGSWVWGSEGGRVASSLHPELGPGAHGELLSPRFVLDRDYMSLRVGGGSAGVHVELLVGRHRRRIALGADSWVMIPHLWDVRPWKGSRARLRIADRAAGEFGYIHVDDILLFDLGGASGP